jgi:hypothetical protein
MAIDYATIEAVRNGMNGQSGMNKYIPKNPMNNPGYNMSNYNSDVTNFQNMAKNAGYTLTPRTNLSDITAKRSGHVYGGMTDNSIYKDAADQYGQDIASGKIVPETQNVTVDQSTMTPEEQAQIQEIMKNNINRSQYPNTYQGKGSYTPNRVSDNLSNNFTPNQIDILKRLLNGLK